MKLENFMLSKRYQTHEMPRTGKSRVMSWTVVTPGQQVGKEGWLLRGVGCLWEVVKIYCN